MKPIIGGPDHNSPQVARAECGGVEMSKVKPIPYSAPVGPTNQMRQGPGLGGDNHRVGTQGTHEHMTGSPGIGGSRSPKGSQR